jgi:hypothetical protein
MQNKKYTIAIKSFTLFAVLCTAQQAHAETTLYPKMAPVDEYLMTDKDAEVALARSAAPDSISRDAEVLILGRHGFKTAVKGKNGFICIVGRGWTSAPDADYWNPKVRVPMCVNAPAAHSYLLRITKLTELGLAGRAPAQAEKVVAAAVARKELPPMAPGAMCYMMSKQGYLNDSAGHWHPHVMFFLPTTEAAKWGANLDGSPVYAAQGAPEPVTTFMVPVMTWSDGTVEEIK